MFAMTKRMQKYIPHKTLSKYGCHTHTFIRKLKFTAKQIKLPIKKQKNYITK